MISVCYVGIYILYQSSLGSSESVKSFNWFNSERVEFVGTLDMCEVTFQNNGSKRERFFDHDTCLLSRELCSVLCIW